MLIDAECWLICSLMLTDTGWCWLNLTDRNWYWLMLIDADWCWLMLIDADRFSLKLICADWCWLVLINADWSWLSLIYAQIRFNQVFFCRSVPPELLWSFFNLKLNQVETRAWLNDVPGVRAMLSTFCFLKMKKRTAWIIQPEVKSSRIESMIEWCACESWHFVLPS